MFQKVKNQKKRRINQKKVKAGSLHPKQNKNPSQNNKRFLKKISASGFTTLTY